MINDGCPHMFQPLKFNVKRGININPSAIRKGLGEVQLKRPSMKFENSYGFGDKVLSVLIYGHEHFLNLM